MSVVGLTCAGDVGPYTTYTNKNKKKVFYDRAPPTRPPTPDQITQRNRYRAVAIDWKGHSSTDRQTWERMTKKLNLPLTGYCLFTWAELTPNERPYLDTIARQSNETIPPYTKR